MSSRSAEGDPRAPRAIGDITSTVIPPPPALGLEMDRARQSTTARLDIPPPPDPNLMTPSSSHRFWSEFLGRRDGKLATAATTIQRGYRRHVQLRAYVTHIHSCVRRLSLARRGAQARIDLLTGYRDAVLRGLEEKVADPAVALDVLASHVLDTFYVDTDQLSTLRFFICVHVGRAIRALCVHLIWCHAG